MQHRDNNAPPLGTIHPEDSASNRLVVVATIAAILLAGSAIVYRTRPNLTFASSSSASDDANTPYHNEKRRKTAGEGARGEMNAASGSGSLFPAGSTVSEGDSLLALGSKEKEGKSSRSKDRRRRGKDPLKDLLKGGGKKYRALALAVSAHNDNDPSPSSSAHNNASINDDHLSEPESNDHSSSLSFASTSLLPDSPSSSPRATSFTKGKRDQLEKSAARTDTPANTAAESAAAPSLSSSATHNTHSRGPSEVSQKHNRMVDGPSSSSSASLENHSHLSHSVTDAYSNFTDDRPPSSLGSASFSHSDDGLGRPHSSLSMADSTTSSSLLPLAEDQARGTGMEDEAHQFDDEHPRRSRAKGRNRPSSPTRVASSSRSPSASTVATTATGATASASLSSSVMLANPDVLTLATSPTLSTYASGSGSGSGSTQSTSTLTSAGEAEAGHNKPSPSGPESSSSGKGKDAKRKAAEQAASLKNSASENAATLTKEKEKEGYKKPPRLQQTPSSSSTAVKSLAASASHPTSLYSPTKTNFAAATSASSSTLISSMSATVSVSATGRASPAVGADEHQEDGDEKEEEEVLTFPTLNPTPVTGPSRLRSDITTGPGSSSPRRAPTPRRPGTPSRSSNTSTPPPLMSPTTASSQPQAGSSSSNNSNSNMPALSTQTQLASLRGALEAARLREEKNKGEMERVGKELEALRWENVNWRRAEGELQTHIRHLMHQVQTYALLLSSMAPHVNPQVLQQYQQYAQQQQQQPQPQAPVHPQPPTNGAANPGGANAGSTSPSTSSAPDVNGYSNSNNNAGSSTSSGGGGTPASNSVPSTPLDASFASSSSSVSSPSPSVATPGGSSQAQVQAAQSQAQGQQQTPTQTQQPPTVPPVLPPLHAQQQMAAPHMNGMASPAAGAVGTPPHPPMMGIHPGSPTPAPFFPYAIPPPPHSYPHSHPGHPHTPFSPLAPPPHQAQALMLQAQQIQQQQAGSGSAPHTPNMNMFSGMFSPPMMSPHQMYHYPAYAAAAAAQAQVQMQMQAFAAAANANANAVASNSSSSSTSTSTSSAASSLLSMSMGTLSISGSGPSSTSSPGSLSPDLNASPSPGAGGGKRRRTRIGRGRSAWEDVGDGWVGVGGGVAGTEEEKGEREGVDVGVNGHTRDSDGDDDGCSHSEFNELVADAIFKRPASLGVRSSSKRGKLRDETENAENDGRNVKSEQLTEFTFPSLSDLGNVKYQYRGGLVAVNGGSSVGGSTPSSSSVSASASVSRSMSISPAPQDESVVPDASTVDGQGEQVKEEVGVDLVSKTGDLVEAEQPAEEGPAPEVAEVLYDSSTCPSTDETPRKETSEPLVNADDHTSSLPEAQTATVADISSQDAQ